MSMLLPPVCVLITVSTESSTSTDINRGASYNFGSDRTKGNYPFNDYTIFKRRDRQAAIDLKAISTCVGKWRRDSETL